MVVNSIVFLLFFSVFFILYWFVLNKNFKHQNLLLLLGSYFFYGWTDWRFLSFLIAVSILNFFIGLYIPRVSSTKKKKILVFIGLLQGIGALIFFKYYNFFVGSFNDAFHSLGLNLNLQLLNILIPLGISFFTFRTISYVLDIYREKLQPTNDWVVFFNYVSFFPTLLSGPIDKAGKFIPQLETTRKFNYGMAADGLRQILWGLFKKVVIADICATITTGIFDNYTTLPASSLLFGAFLYAIQLYADFSGYSDMAIGTARLLGFNITKNFDFPYFAQNIAQYWRKWHISLTAWLTEYVFTPLSIQFRDYGKAGLILAILINFTLVGLWHGANWTYVLYGVIHGFYFIPLILKGTMNKTKKIAKGKTLPSLKELANVLATFTLVMLTMVIFRSETISKAFDYYQHLLSVSIFSAPLIPSGSSIALILLFFISLMIIVEWNAREQQYGIEKLGLKWKRVYRWGMYYSLIATIFYFAGEDQQFIYFQF